MPFPLAPLPQASAHGGARWRAAGASQSARQVNCLSWCLRIIFYTIFTDTESKRYPLSEHKTSKYVEERLYLCCRFPWCRRAAVSCTQIEKLIYFPDHHSRHSPCTRSYSDGRDILSGITCRLQLSVHIGCVQHPAPEWNVRLQSKHRQNWQILCLNEVCFSFEFSTYCYQQYKWRFI